MRTLVIAQDFPWPTTIGSHLRLATVIEVATGLGDTDLFALVPPRRHEPCVVPEDVALARVRTLGRRRPEASALRRLAWLATSRLPLEVATEGAGAYADALAQWAAPAYDFVWVSKAATFELVGRPRLGPTVVDLDDLEDRKILARLAADEAAAGLGGGRRRTMRHGAAVQARRNAARWASLQRSVAGAVERVALCSDLDARRSMLANVAVIPNGYEPPAHALGRPAVGRPPVVTLVGNFCYPPNADGARWLVGEVAPHLWALHPDARIRLVGEPDDSVAALHRPPQVTVTGRVEAMEPELAQADVAAVPLRYGSGTRIKVLEAFAHRIPVVSTTLGAEGIGAEDGRHLLLADEPDAFAAAVARLFEDTALRATLAGAGEDLFLARFRWSGAAERVRTLAMAVAGAGVRGTR